MTAAHNLQSDHDALEDDPLSEYMLTNEEFREIFDREAQLRLGISGEEFVQRWHRGEYPDWDPELANLVMMLPFLGE
jgi:hypothetical protein